MTPFSQTAVPLLADSPPPVDTGDLPSLRGHLDLICSANDQGRSYLSHQSFRAPFHISKPYWNDHALLVQAVNPTAGLFSGDRLECRVEVRPEARLHLTTPSASRLHTMHRGRAELDQAFRVARGAWLDFDPAPLIPQTGCRYQQKTQIDLEIGGELFFIEILAPGRVAHGECFRFAEIDWECNLTYGNRLIARERFCLRPGDDSLNALRTPFPEAYYASCYLVTDRVEENGACWEKIRELNSPDVLIGASRLVAAGWSIKLLARTSLALHQAIRSLRGILATEVPSLLSSARRL